MILDPNQHDTHLLVRSSYLDYARPYPHPKTQQFQNYYIAAYILSQNKTTNLNGHDIQCNRTGPTKRKDTENTIIARIAFNVSQQFNV